MEQDFLNDGIYHNMKMGEFLDLDNDLIKARFVAFMARVSEQSYRRGVQQAIELYEKKAIDEKILEDLHGYRYGTTLNASPGLDGYQTSSISRLEAEVNLAQVGLYTKENEFNEIVNREKASGLKNE